MDHRFILPLLGEYSDSGYREPRNKLLYSLRENAQFLVICAGVALVGLIYVIISYGLSPTLIKSLIMALAYCWGLVLAVYLMGHGLVSIPRSLIRNASHSARLRRLQTKAPKFYEKMEDSLITLEEIEVQVSELGRRKVGSAREFRDWIEELVEVINAPDSQPRSTPINPGADSRILPTVITEKFMADLSRKLMRARHARSRYVNEWDNLVRDASRTQEILDSGASKKLDFGGVSPHAGAWDRTKILTPYTRYLWYFQIMPYVRGVSGVFLAFASGCIVWSEIVKFLLPNLSIIRVSVVHHWVGDKAEVGFAGQAISAFWICYMCTAALIPMTEVKVWRERALVKRNTSFESAFWYGTQVAKLSVPLSYNFLTLLSPQVYKKSIFYGFLGSLIDRTSVGQWFDDFFPILVLFPVLATLFGLYNRVKRIFVGIDLMEDDEENTIGYGSGSWREGRDLIERELGGNSILRRREEAFARLAASSNSGGRAAPVLSVPGVAGSASSPSRSPVRPAIGSSRAGQSSRAQYQDDPPDEENMFQIIGHRMKNTMDTFEAPKWMQGMGQGFKKPKWMGGGDEQRPGTGERSDSEIRRWFGGEGGVRL